VATNSFSVILFRIFGIGSLQGRAGFTTNAYTNDSSVLCLNFIILEPRQCLEGPCLKSGLSIFGGSDSW
jgi:hypothetical protein